MVFYNPSLKGVAHRVHSAHEGKSETVWRELVKQFGKEKVKQLGKKK